MTYSQSIIRNLSKTRRSIEEWIQLIKESGPAGVKEIHDWLKTEFKLGSTTTRLISEMVEGKGTEGTDEKAYLKAAVEYVEDMYSGPKTDLRPIHDELIKLGISLGDDVKISPCKTIVPMYRHHVFAEIKPTTRTWIALGLALKDVTAPLSDRLIATGGLEKGDRITQRFALTFVDEIDVEVDKWLKIAYDLDA